MRLTSINLAVAVLALAASCSSQAQSSYTAVSPDQRTRVELIARDGKLAYTVSRDGVTVIAQSPLGLATSQGSLDGGTLQVTGVERKTVNDTYLPVVGKASRVADHYSQVEVQLAGKNTPIKVNLVARAYDDGIAIRYVLPQQAQVKNIEIVEESTGFHFPADYKCWGFNPGRYENSHEGEFDAVRASAIRPAHLFDAPLVCKTGVRQTTFAIAEADKRNYAGAYYTGRGEGGLGVQVVLSPRVHGSEDAPWHRSAVRTALAEAALATPWRVVMLSDTPGGLVASNLIATLGSPSAIADTSWIKPGKAAWDWWNGWGVDIPNAGVNTATYRAYIDSAAEMGLDYILIDEGWYEGSSEAPKPGSDVTRPVAQMDMPAIIGYARSKGIGVWVWLQWQQLERQMDDALRLYASWGVKGIKVDFMDRNDQDMVGFYHKLLGKAADNRLMVNLHGAYPPDGLLRTYPNYMTQEGVLGAEYNKWSRRITATHNVTLPFTRMILGPIDYTPGGFRALAPEQFPAQVRNVKPFVQTTRGQAVAMYVVYDSPLMMVADSPDAYRNADGSWADGARFIGKVPTSWDETRVLDGDIGEYIVTARRKGDSWYIGAMTNEKARTLDVPLNFTERGVTYRAEILQDGKDVNHLKSSEAQVTGKSRIKLSLAASGGAVVVLTPVQFHVPH